jgi:hypothetical protein
VWSAAIASSLQWRRNEKKEECGRKNEEGRMKKEEGGGRKENTFLYRTLISYQRIFLFSLLLPLSSLLSKQ